MTITITQPGLLATVQDLGRYGAQQYGVIVSGAADNQALRIANMLVGNEEHFACLEITLFGTAITFDEDTLFAVTGGDLFAHLNGEPITMWRPLLAKKGDTLKFIMARTGCRAYIAFAGGIDVPVVMNSRSTYLRAEIGGHLGRALQKNDVLATGRLSSLQQNVLATLKEAPYNWATYYPDSEITSQFVTLRYTTGNEYEYFTKASVQNFETTRYQVLPQSDRMGYRLNGVAVKLTQPLELLSEAVTFGTIQVPPNGQPIVLLTDRQTTGGYPKIGQVIANDLCRLAQLRPMAKIRFQQISHREAEQHLLSTERDLYKIKRAIRFKLKQKILLTNTK